MVNWTLFFTLIFIYSQPIFHEIKAQQPPGYVGCYPNSTANFVDKSLTLFNNGTYCIGVCISNEYRYAATKGQYCKCANETRGAHGNDTRCDIICPGRRSEHCGGKDSVSLYDTLFVANCVEDPHGMRALIVDGSQPKREIFYNNSATWCASYCKESQYMLSGTMNTFCICGDRLRPGFNKSSGCNKICPGKKTETCGGDDSVLLRHTGYIKDTTVTQRPTEPATSSDKDVKTTAVTSSTTATSSTAVTSSTTTTSSTAVTSSTTTTSNTNVTSSTTTKSNTTLTNSAFTSNTTTPSTSMKEIPTKTETSLTYSTKTADDIVTDESTGNTSPVLPSTNANNIVQPEIGTKTGASKGSQLTALYITLPVVVIVSGSVVLIVCLVLRHKRRKRETNVNWPSLGSSNWKANSERNEMSCRVQCGEISTQAIQPDDKRDAEYSTVSENDKLNSNEDYDLINAKPSTGTNVLGMYSHLDLLTGSPGSNVADSTYSHLGSKSRQFTSQTDNTYNSFQFSQLAKNTSAPSLEQDDQNSVYDSASAHDKRQVNEMSEYSHLNAVNTFK